MALHRILTDHRLYANTVSEINKLNETRAKRNAKENVRKEAHLRLLSAYEAELDRSILEGDECAMKDPGPWLDGATAGRAAILFERKRRSLEDALDKLTARLGPDLLPQIEVREAELLAEAREALRTLRAASGELADLRQTVSHLRTRAGLAPVTGPRPTVENVIQAIDGNYSLVGTKDGSPSRSIGFALDQVEIDA